jgi:hypothetical protein
MTQAILREAAGAYAQAFGDRLLAAFALGSLAHGGFSPLVSDLGLVLRDPLRADDERRVAAVADQLRAGGSELHQRLWERTRRASRSWRRPSAGGANRRPTPRARCSRSISSRSTCTSSTTMSRAWRPQIERTWPTRTGAGARSSGLGRVAPCSRT